MDNPFSELYSKEVLKHIINPQNLGEMVKPDGVGTVGNRICGDIMRLFIKVGSKKDGTKYIKDIKFQTLGCGAAISSSSIITTLVKGMGLEKALNITKDEILKALGGLPKTKIHCSVLADEALKVAIEDYQNKQNSNKS